VFFGAALYVSLVQHPAALETGTDFAALAAFCWGADRAWLVAAILMFFVIPFTLFVVDPVNQQIKSIRPSDERALDLLNQWGRLHWFRTFASGVSFMLCVAGLGRHL
jgi:hypothetical protein